MTPVHSTWRECRIENIDIYSDVHFCVAHTTLDSINDALDAGLVDLSGGDGTETAVSIVAHIALWAS